MSILWSTFSCGKRPGRTEKLLVGQVGANRPGQEPLDEVSSLVQ